MEKGQAFFKGKTVVITGASSGIGATSAVEFAKLGANLVITGRNVDNLKQVKNSCLAEGLKDNQVVFISGDIADEEIQRQLINGAINNFNNIDVVVNNAGISKFIPLDQLTLKEFDETYNVNLRASVALALLALPHLLKTKGNIVNVSSVASYLPVQHSLDYCVAKACMDNFTKSLAFEVAPHGVRVNSVNPGGVATNIGRSITPEIAQKMANMGNMHPIGRIGTTKEIADAIIFLASDQATFITGHIMSVGGGANVGGTKLA